MRRKRGKEREEGTNWALTIFACFCFPLFTSWNILSAPIVYVNVLPEGTACIVRVAFCVLWFCACCVALRVALLRVFRGVALFACELCIAVLRCVSACSLSYVCYLFYTCCVLRYSNCVYPRYCVFYRNAMLWCWLSGCFIIILLCRVIVCCCWCNNDFKFVLGVMLLGSVVWLWLVCYYGVGKKCRKLGSTVYIHFWSSFSFVEGKSKVILSPPAHPSTQNAQMPCARATRKTQARNA